jgi:hypothetical protein
MTPGRIVAPLALVLAAGSLAAVLGRAPLSGGARSATVLALSEIARSPKALAGRSVIFAGEVAPSQYFSPADAAAAFVVGDTEGHRVLVLPAAGVYAPPRLPPGSYVRITGRVSDAVAREPAPGKVGFDLSVGAVLARSRAATAVRADTVEPRRNLVERHPGQPRISRTTVRRLIRRPGSFKEGIVAVSGHAHRIGPYGFVLGDRRSAIFVAARPEQLRAVTNGERIRVRGALDRISRFRAHTIAATISARPAPRRGARSSRRPPSKPGRPFVLLRQLSGA